MKKFLFLLMLGVAGVAVAAVVSDEEAQVRKPKVLTMDATKVKIIRKARPEDNRASDETVSFLQRYSGVLTKDNVDAVENISQMMQDEPKALAQRFASKKLNNDPLNGSSDYQKTDPDASVTERFAMLQPPSLTGSRPGATLTKDDMRQAYEEARKKIEFVGRKQLGQKQTSITLVPTVDDIKNSGIDLSQLPENWEEIVKENQKKAQELKKQSKAAKSLMRSLKQ